MLKGIEQRIMTAGNMPTRSLLIHCYQGVVVVLIGSPLNPGPLQETLKEMFVVEDPSDYWMLEDAGAPVDERPGRMTAINRRNRAFKATN